MYPWGRYPTEVSDAALRVRRTGQGHRQHPARLGRGQHAPRGRRALLAPTEPDDGRQHAARCCACCATRRSAATSPRAPSAPRHTRTSTCSPCSPPRTSQVCRCATSHGNWHDVPCDFGSIAINCGDMLQLASDGYYPSTHAPRHEPHGRGRHAVAAVAAAVPAPGRRRRARRGPHGLLVPAGTHRSSCAARTRPQVRDRPNMISSRRSRRRRRARSALSRRMAKGHRTPVDHVVAADRRRTRAPRRTHQGLHRRCAMGGRPGLRRHRGDASSHRRAGVPAGARPRPRPRAVSTGRIDHRAPRARWCCAVSVAWPAA